MRLCVMAIASLFCLGVVDFIESGMARIEFQTGGAETYHADLPVHFFPCEVKEGDPFYAIIIDGVTEIRCGEPPLD